MTIAVLDIHWIERARDAFLCRVFEDTGLLAAKYANRNPSWAEYRRANPCEQQAIFERWSDILREAPTWDNTVGLGAAERIATNENWHRALVGCLPAGPDIQHDYELIDSYRTHDHGA